MERFFKRHRSGVSSSSNVQSSNELVEYGGEEEVKLNLSDIVTDPGLRKPVDEFDVNIRDEVRREYVSRGPCQLTGHVYPKTAFGNHERSFQDVWYKKFPWLEYSVSKDAAFCFWCYLFKPSDKGGRYGVDTFTRLGFNNWKKALEKFNSHVGAVNSCHNIARMQFESFRNQSHDIAMLQSFRQEMDAVCSTRLTTILDATRLLLKQGLPFCGQAPLFDPSNRGNFVELVELLCQLNPDISKALSPSAPGNDQLITPEIQKQFAHACAAEVTFAIVNDIGGKTFTLLVEEARGSSMEEQMGVIIRYVNKEGCAVERFLAMVHVSDDSSYFSKNVIHDLFAKHDLSLSKLRGLGYDAGSCMRDEFKELKVLILEEHPRAIYCHCFSYQLQSLIIAIGKGVYGVHDVISKVSLIVSTIGAPCKMSDQLRQSEHDRLVNELDGGEIESGDTRWGSHYLTLLRLCSLWSSVEQVLDNIQDNATYSDDRCTAYRLLDRMYSFEFVLALHLMKHILGITNELSLILQQKEQNIIQAMSLINTVKYQLQSFKEDGWKIILNEVNSFCELNYIPGVDMEARITRPGYKKQIITNFQYYHDEIFCQVFFLSKLFCIIC